MTGARPGSATGQPEEETGGWLAVKALAEEGVSTVFTLSGGHIFPLLDGCHRQGVRIVDVRHEQSAVFAAEALAKCTRRPGVAMLTAGPGVTNGVSAVATARFNGSPVLVLGGRAPASRWGSGSLQEMDHVPVMAPITKSAATVESTAAIYESVASALATAGGLSPGSGRTRGPVFLDIPLDALFGRAQTPGASQGAPGSGEKEASGSGERSPAGSTGAAGHPGIDKAISMLAAAKRPMVVAGSEVWWDGAWAELRTLAEEARLPVVANGMGRGCLPADHPNAFSRIRSMFRESDCMIVVGTPLDFRLSFGRFGEAPVIHLMGAEESLAAHVPLAAAAAGDLRDVLRELAGSGPGPSERADWLVRLADGESRVRSGDEQWYMSDSEPIHPGRIYGELRRVLDRDAIVIGDGGDFVSFAGRLVDVFQPGCWLDAGPFGCLGTGLGYAMGARVAHPDRQVVLLAGDGAFGFSGFDVDTLVRQNLPVVMVVGNNGIWGLEKHPMKMVYGYDVAADLQAGCRYDEVVAALGGAGETVRRPAELAGALERAFRSGAPYLVNVITDPAAVYPRTSNLA